jgi:hypothetical protein
MALFIVKAVRTSNPAMGICLFLNSSDKSNFTGYLINQSITGFRCRTRCSVFTYDAACQRQMWECYMLIFWEFSIVNLYLLTKVAALSMAWSVFASSNTGIAGSNPTRGMDICVCLFRVFVLRVGSGLATGWSPVQEVLLTLYRFRNWKIGKTSARVVAS